MTLHKVWKAIFDAMVSWHQGKLFVEHAIAINHDTLHLLAGLLLWLVIALLLRRPISSWIPWLWLFAFIAWNETVDLWLEQWPDAGEQYGEGAKDILLTMLVPTVLIFAARLRPDLFRSNPRAATRRRRGRGFRM